MKDRLIRESKQLWEDHRNKLPIIACLFVCLVIYTCSRGKETFVHVYDNKNDKGFKDGHILGADSIYTTKERLFEKKLDELLAFRTEFQATTQKLNQRMDSIESFKKREPQAEQGPELPSSETKKPKEEKTESPPNNSTNFEVQKFEGGTVGDSAANRYLQSPSRRFGPSVITFPVSADAANSESSVVLPAGSYVKAKLMTGVEAPEGKTYPVLLQLDYAYIVPNDKRLDLAGCFMVAKSQGDLSTERVQMQATTLSCVSKDGEMFEREVNGFVADDKDNSFAVVGSVSSKQDRVASMAFLSSIVEGVGMALQQAQTTQNTNPLGGSQSVVTGDQMTHIGAGGAANAASLVTQWYLKQAQNLLPTINVGSGQDVWVVMAEKTHLPNQYFRRNEGGNGDYSYFSRILD